MSLFVVKSFAVSPLQFRRLDGLGQDEFGLGADLIKDLDKLLSETKTDRPINLGLPPSSKRCLSEAIVRSPDVHLGYIEPGSLPAVVSYELFICERL